MSIAGKHYDHTREPLNRSILVLAVPMVLEALMGSLFAIIDMLWLSRLGADAITAVAVTESVMGLIYAVAIGMAIAATAIVSRRIGENNFERAAQSAAQLLLLGLVVAVALGLVLGYFAVDILQLLGASHPVVATGADYARLMFGANGIVFLLCIINAIFRGAGEVALPLRALVLANVINLLLAPNLIFGWGPFPELGVTGAGIATNIARGIALLWLLWQLWKLFERRSGIRVGLRHCRLELRVLGPLLRTSTNGMAQVFITSTTWIALLKILAMYGSPAVAGFTIAARVVAFALMPTIGFSGAAATLVGQNLGALQIDRADAAVRVAAKLNTIVLTATGAVVMILAEPIALLFTTDPSVLAEAVSALRVWSLVFPFYAAWICFGAAFNGAGDTRTPMRTSLLCLWLGQVPLAWVLSGALELGPLGVYIAVPTSSAVHAVMNYALFKRGKWKLQSV
jgi:putative MATE family efflux protein